MAFADEADQVAKRGPGRPRKPGLEHETKATAAAPAGPARPKPKYDPDKMYRVTKQEIEGGHQGPVPLTVVTEKGTFRRVLIPGRPVVVSGHLLNESLEHAVVDERGPDLERNLEGIAQGETTSPGLYDSEGRVRPTRTRTTGVVKKRFSVEVEEV